MEHSPFVGDKRVGRGIKPYLTLSGSHTFLQQEQQRLMGLLVHRSRDGDRAAKIVEASHRWTTEVLCRQRRERVT